MSTSLRHRLFEASFAVMDATRLDRLLAPVVRGAGAILMFHHVRPWAAREFAPNRILEITPEFLDETVTAVRTAGFDIVPLDAVPDRLARPGKRPFAVLTFDDGYRDNAVHAEPILRRHDAPWTLFVTTDFADGRCRLWWIELEEAIRVLPRVTVAAHGIAFDAPAGTASEKQAAFEGLYWILRAGSEERLLAVVGDLAAQAGIDSAALVRDLCMDWSELGQLARNLDVTIGAHTLSHCIVAKHDDATVRRELGDSRDIIERRLGRPVRHLAFPVGDAGSAGPRDFAIARETGYSTAVTTRPGHVYPSHRAHLHALPRVSINGNHQNGPALRGMLSGLPFLAWNLGRRVNVG